MDRTYGVFVPLLLIRFNFLFEFVPPKEVVWLRHWVMNNDRNNLHARQ